jgi:hypothetical protein
MRPYVIKQGDYLAKLAYTLGFDANTVWNDPKNADLRTLRPDPNILWPTDVLYIPDPVDAAPMTLSSGTTNTFVTDPPTIPMNLRFLEPECASQACTVQELPLLTGLTTDSNGSVSFSVPITSETLTVAFTDSGKTFTIALGALDPIDTLSGVFQRLQNLGYIDVDADFFPPNIDLIRMALRSFKAARGVDSSPPASSPVGSDIDGAPPSSLNLDSVPNSSPPPSDDSSSSTPASSPDGSPPTGETDSPPPSAPPSSASSPESGDSTPPPSASSPDASADSGDNGGLSDDGTLDDATSKLLVAAHGS